MSGRFTGFLMVVMGLVFSYQGAFAFTIDDCATGEAPSSPKSWDSAQCGGLCEDVNGTVLCHAQNYGCVANADLLAVNYTGNEESITIFGECSMASGSQVYCCHIEGDGKAAVTQVELYGSVQNDEEVGFTYQSGSYNLEYWSSTDLLPLNGVASGLQGKDGIRGSHSVRSDYTEFLYGDVGDDTIWGNSGHYDVILGHGGDDSLYGGNGVDYIDGGTGDDIIHGGNGNDRLFGRDGEDSIYGGFGFDEIDGGADGDILEGGGQGDRIVGGSGADILKGQGGIDWLYGGDGDDTLFGGNHDDYLHGGAGSDTLAGHSGNDVLYGGLGNADALAGGSNNDTLCGTSFPEFGTCPTILDFSDASGSADKAWLEESGTCTAVSLVGNNGVETVRPNTWNWSAVATLGATIEASSTPFSECQELIDEWGR